MYYTEGDTEVYAKSAKDPDEVLAFLAGSTNHWAYGNCQKLRERMSLSVPAANVVSANVGKAQQSALSLMKEWIKTVSVDDEADLVLVAVKMSIYAFCLNTGSRLAAWEGLHAQHISKVCAVCSYNEGIYQKQAAHLQGVRCGPAWH